MPAYLLTYHGGELPRGDEDEMELIVTWAEWLDSLGDALIDGGNPAGEAARLDPDGTLTPLLSNRISSYTMFDADDLEAATTLARSCPLLSLGTSIEITELIELDDDLFDDEEDEEDSLR